MKNVATIAYVESCIANIEAISDIPVDNEALQSFLKDLLYNLEYDIQSAMMWFDNSYMKLNKDKCHFLISDNVMGHL